VTNKIVIRYADGKIRKGATQDFSANKNVFHLNDKDSGECVEIHSKDLKAVFFVKDFDGNPEYNERNDRQRVGLGRRIQVHFKDGETIVGYTQGFTREREGFLLFPCDPDCNNDKVFVVTAATDSICFVP
jgi:hypothetical protein